MITELGELGDVLTTGTVDAHVERLRQRGLADEASLNALLGLAEQAAHEQPRLAAEIADMCAALGAEQRLDAVRGRSSYLRARLAAERGELAEALGLINEARRAWTDAGNLLGALRTDLGRMQILDDLGRHSETANVGQSLLHALDAYAGSGPELALCRQFRATASNNLGATYCLIGDHERSMDAYALAERTFLELGLDTEAAQPQANRGIGLLALGRPRKAMQVLRRAARTFAGSGDRLWAAKCDGYVAQAHQQLGELVAALALLQRSRATLDELGAHAEAARSQLAAAGLYLAVGLLAEARDEAVGAVASTATHGLRHDNAFAQFTVAILDLRAGKLIDAERGLRAAASAFDALGDRQYWARVLLAQADLAARQEQRGAAVERATTAADSLQDGGWQIPLGWARLQLADLAEPDQVEARLDAAGAVIDTIGLPQLRYAYALRRARVRRGDRPAEAERFAREAVTIIEGLGTNLVDPVLHSAFRADKLEAHDLLVEILIDRGHPDALAEACVISDDVKARTLIDMVSGTIGARPARDGHPTSDLEALIERRRADLTATYNALASLTSPMQRSALLAQADEDEAQVAALRLRRAVMFPPAAGQVSDAGTLSTAQRGSASPAQGTTLAYHVAGEDIIVFVVHERSTTCRRLHGTRPAARAALTRLNTQWARFRLGTAVSLRSEQHLLATVQHDLRTLHDLLVAPVAGLLTELVGERADAAELTVVPHRELHQIPFHALFDGEHYLNQHWTISLAPTISGSVPPMRPSPDLHGTLVLAAPDERAPAIETEARAVAAAMPASRLVLGERATVQCLRESVPGPAFIHLACHGLYRPSNPLFSALRLADRWVQATEILDLDLAGALVALSACESGRRGEDSAEPIGLAWAFLAAGASGVLVSQWIVDDISAADVMSRTYRGLAAGDPPAIALRQAQLAVAETSPHPFHWAPFVHVTSPSNQLIGAAS